MHPGVLERGQAGAVPGHQELGRRGVTWAGRYKHPAVGREGVGREGRWAGATGLSSVLLLGALQY